MNQSSTKHGTQVDSMSTWALDYKRIVFKALRYWYAFIASVLLALTIAFLYNRYATKIYPITASVIVKEVDDLSGGDLLYNNPLVNFRRNYLNETYVIKSYPLIQRVLEDLNFDVSFLKEGKIVTTEAYEDLPFAAIADRKVSRKEFECVFTVLNSSEFEITEPTGGEVEPHKLRGVFGDTLALNGFRGVFVVRDKSSIAGVAGVPFIFKYVPAETLVNNYVQALNVSWAEQGAGVLNLSIREENRAKGIDFLSGLIQQYREYDLQNKNEAASRTVEFISMQLDEISDSLRNVENQLQQFKGKNVVTDLSAEALRLYEKVEGLEGQKAELLVRRNYYSYLTDYVSRSGNLDQIILPSSIGISDPILSTLVTKMTELQLEINSSKGKENPLLSDARRRLDLMRRDIVESIRNLEATDKIKINFIDKQIAAIEAQMGRLPLTQRNLVAIQRNYSLLEGLYMFLLQKMSEASISRAANTSGIIVVNPPIAGGVISPNVSLNYALALCIGVMLPILVLVVREFLNDRIQSREEIERFTAIPFIGGIGHKKAPNNLEVLSNPRTGTSEAFRALRSNLNYFVADNDRAVFMITSSIGGEGKTFTSINLASVLSLSGKRTLIVGADMRKPKLFDDFGLTNDVGLSTYLAGLGSFDEVLQRTGYPNIDLISGGPVPPNPAELLLGERIAQFVHEAKDRYDYIVIDTPPLAIVTDAFALAPFVDHTLFMVRQNYTPRHFLKAIDDFFTSGKLKNISIVFNDIYKSGGGYGYGYHYYYGYSGDHQFNGYYYE